MRLHSGIGQSRFCLVIAVKGYNVERHSSNVAVDRLRKCLELNVIYIIANGNISFLLTRLLILIFKRTLHVQDNK